MADQTDVSTSKLGQEGYKFPLVETLAVRLFVAEMGHTGMTWDQLDEEFGQGEYVKKARRVLEGWWNPEAPFVILDLANDELMLADEIG